jgi:hypothetical protein
MDSIATNDDFAATRVALDEEKGELGPDTPKADESVKKTAEMSENMENIGTELRDTVTHAPSELGPGENIDSPGNVATVKETVERPKRNARPSAKSIESRIQADEEKLERLWAKVVKATSHLQDAPNSVDEILK